jgi:hypothetical protein
VGQTASRSAWVRILYPSDFCSEPLDLVQDLLARVRDEHPDIDATDPTMFETALAEIHGNVVRHGRPPARSSTRSR